MPSATVCFSALIAAPAHTPNTSRPRPPNPDTFLLLPLRRRAADATALWSTWALSSHMSDDSMTSTHDEDCDMLVIGSGVGGSVVALQLTKKRYRTGLLVVGRRSPDEHFAEEVWDIKRFAWAPLGLKGTRRILWLPRVVIHGHFVNRCWRGILDKQSQYLPLLSAALGCLRRAMRRCTAAYSATEGRSSPSNSLAGLPWHEFIRRVAAAEADAERAQSSVHIFLRTASERPSRHRRSRLEESTLR